MKEKRKTQKKLGRRVLKWGLLVGLLLLFPTAYIIVWRTWFTSHSMDTPSGIPGYVEAERQTEGHTCAVHSLQTIYRAYGLDPKEENLRFRLGADFYSLVWMRDSTGTLHPDINMVLAQDGFAYRAVNPQDIRRKAEVRKHLDSGHLALALIRRRQSGNLHWVVLQGEGDKGVRVFDSLSPEPYFERSDDFWSSVMVSTVLLRPRSVVDEKGSSIGAHLSGAWHTITMLPRL